jgi:hypothetical protein
LKALGIEIHVIAMGAEDADLKRMRDCATSDAFVEAVPRGTDLVPLFKALALQLVPPRLVR